MNGSLNINDYVKARHDKGDTWFVAGLWLAGLASASIVILIMVFLAIESKPALWSIGVVRLFTDPSWHPAGGAAIGRFNLISMLVGTLLVTAGAITIAAMNVPGGVGLASANALMLLGLLIAINILTFRIGTDGLLKGSLDDNYNGNDLVRGEQFRR